MSALGASLCDYVGAVVAPCHGDTAGPSVGGQHGPPHRRWTRAARATAALVDNGTWS